MGKMRLFQAVREPDLRTYRVRVEGGRVLVEI
jgi:nitrite reductase/ring-hydroxylating ferredoxin subunit